MARGSQQPPLTRHTLNRKLSIGVFNQFFGSLTACGFRKCYGNIVGVKAIEPPDSYFVSAANGWLELGDCTEALTELERVNPCLRSHPEVLRVRYSIHSVLQQWDSAAEAAVALLEQYPSDPQVWVFVAYATRRKPGGGIDKAKEILLVAQQRFPKEPLIAYNLACYECQLNHLEEAKSWLAKAFEIGSQTMLRKMAMDDPDLKPLWPALGVEKA